MSTLLHGESRRMYSWWWDSHISPKNSKWLQENLTDMDRNVKAMIKLIEEDADSFARRAEMYYKKRPELLKLIEEFYRAYRALAERYDHATGALRQAHRTMAEAFPNQILPITSDESPSSSGTEFGPHTPEMPSPMHAPLDLADLQKDVLGVSSNFHARRWKGAYSEESKSLSSKEGLKQLKEMFPSGEGLTHAKSEGKVRKVLNFEEEEGNANEKEDLKSEIKRLQGEVSQLTTRNENLMTQMASESQHARTLEETISKLEAMKEAALLQYKLSIEWMSSLEADICNTRDELDKVNNEMAVKLNSIEEQCLAMEKVNKSLRLELVNHQKELEKGDRELEELKTSLEAEEQKRMQAEVALMSLEQIHTHSQEEAELLVLEIQCGSEKLKEMELNKVGLEEKISELNEIIGNLHEQNISFDLKIKDLHDEMKLLKETKEELEHELGIYMEERKALQDELFCLQEDQRDLEQRNRGLTEQMEVVSEKNVVLENSLSDVNVELGGLRVTANALEASCETLLGEVSTHVVEKGVLVSQIEIISQNMERLSEKSTSLENSLSDAHAELEGLRARFKDMEECCMSLCNQNSIHLAEKNALVSQVENLGNKYLELQNQQLILEKERDSNVHQVMELQCSLTLEKQEHEVFLSSSSSQLASLHNQINLLEEQLCIKMDDFELEQQKVMNYLLEIFILKSCLHDVNDKNLFLFGECQNLLEASRCAKDQISQLKHTELMQKEELTSLSECNGVLMKGIHLLLDALSIDVNQKTASDITEEVLVQIILVEVNNLLNSLSDTWEENRRVLLQVADTEAKCLILQDQLANLEKEKDSVVHQVMDLESSLRLEKRDHEALILSLSNQLASLQNQIHLLQEDIQVRDEELEVEQTNTLKAHLENLIFQRCLRDMKDNNMLLSGECRNLLEAHRCAEKQISDLEYKGLIQNEELNRLSNLSNNLWAGIHLLLEALNLDIEETIDDPADEAVLETISGEIRNLLGSISDAHNENQCLHLEILVLVTLFKQIGVDNFQLHQELESRNKELVALSSEKLKLMEMCKHLEDENNILVSKVVNFESKCLSLQDQLANLEKEKESTVHQVMDLESSLRLEKKEHEVLILSLSNQLASLQNQIHLLQEDIQVRDEELEVEQQNTIKAHLENLILQRCLCDMKDNNLILSEECQNLLEAHRCAEKQISDLEYKGLIQNEELTLLSNLSNNLQAGVHLLLEALNLDGRKETMDDRTDEAVLETILGEIRNLRSSISDAHDENLCLHLQLLVHVTLFKQIRVDNFQLHQELESRTKKLVALSSEKLKLMETSKQLEDENNILVSKIETTGLSLEMLEVKHAELEDKNLNLEIKYAELEDKNLNLGREKDLSLHQILELENSLELEKEERHALISSSKNRIASLATQLDLLQEERQVKEDEFEREQQKASDALLENFILQRCLSDVNDRNLILSEECQRLLDASRCSDKLISEVQHECHIQQKEMKLISENNEKLGNGILLLLKEFNINMDCGTVDGTKGEVMLEALLDQIKAMLNSFSNVQEKSQSLCLEISVLGTLLKEIALEKVQLYYEIGSRNEEVLLLQEKKDEAMEENERLKVEMLSLVEQLSHVHASHQASQTEIHNLHEVNWSLSKGFYDLKEKMVALEEENNDILAEALTLDHLFIFFKAQDTERALKLKLLSDNICSILAVKNYLEEENRVQNERIRKLEVQTMDLNESAILQEFDLNMATNFCEEFYLQIEAAENLLLQKEMELAEAREESAELCRNLETVSKDLDGAVLMQRELKVEINTLSLGIVSKEGEITEILEANRFLHKELDRLNCEVEVLGIREEYLTTKLQKGINEVNKCEGEIQTLLDDIQLSTVNAAIFEEKLLEQIVACESIQTVSMLQREKLDEEIALKSACAYELKKELDNLKRENGTLVADLNAYSTLVMSLFDGVACVEELIFSLAKLQDREVNGTSDAPECKKSGHQPSKNDSTLAKAGFLDLQKLIAKIEALQKVIIDFTNLLQQERLESNAKIEAARKEIEELKLQEMLLHEKSKEKYGQIMKDIQLDQVSRSRVSSYSANKNENGEADDQMLELWETAERDDIEAVEEVKSEYPSSELIAEKELSIDKLELSTRVNESSAQVGNKRLNEKLDSDAQMLSVLQRSLQGLKTKVEKSEKKKHPKTSEYGTLKAQLREVEEAILELSDTNRKLKKKVEDNFESSNAVIWEKERRQVSEQARGGWSEKIAKLELELQKIDYIFLKVEEEEENLRTGFVDRKSSTLRDYLSGKKDGKGKRKSSFCGCMRPRTKA